MYHFIRIPFPRCLPPPLLLSNFVPPKVLAYQLATKSIRSEVLAYRTLTKQISIIDHTEDDFCFDLKLRLLITLNYIPITSIVEIVATNDKSAIVMWSPAAYCVPSRYLSKYPRASSTFFSFPLSKETPANITGY